MNSEYKIRKITSLHDSCNNCGLSIINCICNSAPKTRTNAKLWILSVEKEFYRPSNTARLLKLVNPESTEIFLWERTREPEKLIENLKDSIYNPYLVFPAEDEELEERRIKAIASKGIPAFIIVDGTWKEARKIVRKSEYLRTLPIISLDPENLSEYDLRRGVGEGNLCTIEAAMEVLKLEGENHAAVEIDGVYKAFLKRYKASRSGHELKEQGNQ